MITSNRTAFSLLIEQYVTINKQEVEDAKRYIKTTDEEKEWIKTANIIDIIRITPSTRVIQILFQEKLYFAVIGAQLKSNLLDDNIINEIESNAGLITLLISDGLMKIDKKANNLEFYDSILFQHQEKEYKGHNYKDLIDFLEVIHFFEVPQYSLVEDNWTSRIACYIFSKNSSQLILDFDNNFTDLVSELSIVGSDNISYHILLSCLFSNSYKHAFLELYRLVERLFPITYLKEFHVETDSKLNFLVFVSQLENITKWRHREDEAVEKIFSNTKPSIRNYFETFLNSSLELQNQKDYTFFYNLRNSIVHFRSNHMEHELTTNQWNLLLIATLFLIDEQYSINNSILQ